MVTRQETIVSTLILSTFQDPKKKENLIFYEGSIWTAFSFKSEHILYVIM